MAFKPAFCLPRFGSLLNLRKLFHGNFRSHRLQAAVVYSVQSPASNLKMPPQALQTLQTLPQAFAVVAFRTLRKLFPWQLSEPQAAAICFLRRSKLPFAGPQTPKMPPQALQTLQTLPHAFRFGSVSNLRKLFPLQLWGKCSTSFLGEKFIY